MLQYCFCFMFWPQGDLSSSTRNQTLTSCVRSLNCWTTREVTGFLLFSSFFWFLFYSPLWTLQKFTILLHPPYQTSAPFCSIDTRSPALFGAWGKSASAVGSLPTLWLIQTMVEKASTPRTFLVVCLIFPSIPCTSHGTADLGLTSLVTFDHDDYSQFP